MSIRKTVITALVLGILLMIYIWDQQRLHTDRAEETRRLRLTDLTEDRINEIRVYAHDEKLVIRRTDEQWMITEPVATPADEMKVRRILTGFVHSRRESSFEVDPSRFKDFGVLESGWRIEFVGRKDRGEEITTRLYLGLPTPLGENYYARIGQNIFLVTSKLHEALSPRLLDVRDRRTLDANLTQATGIWLSWGPNMITANKTAARWFLTQPVDFDADQEALASMLRVWDRAKGADYQDKVNAGLETYGLDKPYWAGTVQVMDAATTRHLTLMIGDAVTTGSEPERYWAKRVDDETVFSIPVRLVNQLMPENDTLMSKNVVTIPLQKIQRAEFNLQGSILNLVRDSTGVWRLEDEPETMLDQKVVGEKLQVLSSLQAMIYLEDGIDLKEETRLSRPILMVSIYSEDGGEPQIIAVGRKHTLEDYSYARRMDTGLTFGIYWQIPGKLFLTRDEVIDHSIFSYSEEVVHRVVIHDNQGQSVEFSRGTGGSWKYTVSTDTRVRKVSSQRMTNLILTVGGLEWSRELYPDDPDDIVIIKTKNLGSPKRTIQLYDIDGESVARLDFAGDESEEAYIRVDETRYYSLDRFRLLGVIESLKGLYGQIGPTRE
jgi:hypothetical protein